MIDLLAQAHVLLRQAQRKETTPVNRLRALGLMAQAIDLLFVTQAISAPTGHRQDTAAVVAGLLHDGAVLAKEQIIPQLSKLRLRLAPADQLGEQQHIWLFSYFRQRIYPLLTPLAVDPGHPFPYISSDSLNLLVVLQRPGRYERLAGPLFARLKIPRRVVPRLIDVPPLAEVDSPVLSDDADWKYWVWSEDVVRFFVHELFAGMSVTGIYQFRVLRAGAGGGMEAEVFEPRSVRDKLAPVVRLDVQSTMPSVIVHWLGTRLDAPAHSVYRCGSPGELNNLLDLASQLEGLLQPAMGIRPALRRAFHRIGDLRKPPIR
jgi:polyphosphate kinase